MSREEVLKLINKYVAGECNAQEIDLLETWYVKQDNLFQHELTEAGIVNDLQEVFENLPKAKIRVVLWPGLRRFKVAVWAAAILLISGAAFYFYKNEVLIPGYISAKKLDIPPGKNTATLTLADGKKIILSEANSEQLLKASGVNITNAADGRIIYDAMVDANKPDNSSKDGTAKNYNTLSTAKGETYQVRLPDGTWVWLNAASSLKYPVSFAALKNRTVELTGEAYFEVKKKKVPFIVVSNKQKVEVLGTHFNVSSYADEARTKTTLLEGAVKVSSFQNKGKDMLLKPGQQAILDQAFKIVPVDVAAEVAWKEGNFVFNDEDLQSILRKVSRWYNVEVIYRDRPQGVSLLGAISRTKNISSVLNALEQTGKVHFKIEEGRIIVMK